MADSRKKKTSSPEGGAVVPVKVKKRGGFMGKTYEDTWLPITDELLEAIPEGALRIRVKDESGKIRWRKVNKILEADLLNVDKNNIPYAMFNEIGRKKIRHATLFPATRHPKTGVAVTDLAKQKQMYHSRDPLLQSAFDIQDEDMLAKAVRELAVEASFLGFERSRAETAGNSMAASQFSLRRMKAITGMVDVYLKRHDVFSGKTIDLNSSAFLKLFQFLVDTFEEVMAKASIPPDQIETARTELSKRIEDETWISEAVASMKEG